MSNILLEQYGIHKMKELRDSPFSCLLESNIEKTPHQISAFVSAIQSIKNGGIILADEVGLGKTIEAGLALKYLIKKGAKRILIAMPPALRKQWQVELKTKFKIDSVIPDNKYAVGQRDAYDWQHKMYKQTEPLVVITSYGMAPWLIEKFNKVRWDCLIFDEAHKLRNYPKSKMPKALFDASRGFPKVMLTATPIQNYLSDLYALTHFIDEKIFINETVFEQRYVNTGDYKGLREAISPILHRTLRKDVAEYLKFTKRDCMAVDFVLTDDEALLYRLANSYLQRTQLFAVNAKNTGLVRMIIRKLLASSSYAVAETFEVLRQRLKVLKQDTRVEKAETSLKGFFDLLDGDDAEEEINDDIEYINLQKYRAQIDDEMQAIENIIAVANRINVNSKSTAVIQALSFAFETQRHAGVPEKALIFTESKRTQKYLVDTLTAAGFDDIVVFNGELSNPETKKIYNAWKGRFPANMTNTPSVDLKHAIVDHFQHKAKILIATDIASEGLNLQFCDTVINYDLPWNPMKIEQRIGRCHRFGQKRDVWVYNLLNTENAADRRVYEILDQKFNLFRGVFGASDEALGLLESGSSFEKQIMDIYQQCKTQADFKREFDKLERTISIKRGDKYQNLKTILNQSNEMSKKAQLEEIYNSMQIYVQERIFWEKICRSPIDPLMGATYHLKQPMGVDGYIFVGCVCRRNTEFIEPYIYTFDKNGNLVSVSQDLSQFVEIPPNSFVPYVAGTSEQGLLSQMHNTIALHFKENYKKRHASEIEVHRRKVVAWTKNKKDLREAQIAAVREVVALTENRLKLTNVEEERKDIQKELTKWVNTLAKYTNGQEVFVAEIEKQAMLDEENFIQQFEIDPVIIVNLVVKLQG